MNSTNRTKQPGRDEGPTGASITLAQLQELCDDPARDLPGGENVRAMLTFDLEAGFYLSAQDGRAMHQVIDAEGNQVRFRTIEGAMSVLQSIAGLNLDILLLQPGPQRGQH